MDVKISDIEKALEYYLSSIVNIPVIESRQSSPRPHGNYITYEAISISKKYGIDNVQFLSDTKYIRSGQRIAVYQIDCYRDNSFQILTDVRDSLDSQNAIDYFASIGIAIFQYTGILNISTALDTKFEKRCSMDLEIRYTIEKTEDLGNIDRITVTRI